MDIRLPPIRIIICLGLRLLVLCNPIPTRITAATWPAPRVRVRDLPIPIPTQYSGGHGTASVPRVKITEQSRPPSRASSSKRGFIERLRGGRSSTYGSSAGTETPASSSYYPTYPTRSSLLNPPVPLSVAPLEPPPRLLLQSTMPPLPSPAATEDSRTEYADGLLNPAHSALAIGMDANVGNASSLTLGDHVDYSRPFGGFVFNRMDSSTTVGTADTRTTRTQTIRTPGPSIDILPPEHEYADENETGPGHVADGTNDRNSTPTREERSYFSPR
ncbi:hypothetical protein BT96DRAFT_183041 [Gymnopus androsaceus JB14]|uniref:Uncharacterized protein n=1 Tax=Gymnopus androsaceus JB14 TaxID=1447944 RepID=A0A6A4HBE5_9AGAR|nr:hypothetical protein BT96DRAFT_183041 [Gymnopus androsaceus JB14]